jgi:DNA topoisomerase-2
MAGGKKKFDLIPYFKGFAGKVVKGDNPGQWYIYGKITKVNTTKILIEEIPITYDLDGYRKVLNALEENQIIKSSKDLSENDTFKFEIQCTREFGTKTDDQLYDELKLVKTVTENYTCIDADNSIVEFQTLEELLEAYYTSRIKYYDVRKKNVIRKIEALLVLYVNKLKFIKAILDGKLVLNKRKQADVEVDLAKLGIAKIDESYKYLFDMSIMSVTYELLNELTAKCKAKKEELDEYKKKTDAQLWEEDISAFIKIK